MKFFSLFHITPFLVIFACCSTGKRQEPPFTITETDQRIELMEDSNTVFIYQKKPKTLTGEYVCNNYIHPLFNLNGDVLTEEFPPDHLFHRGVFWAWSQLYVENKRIGDGWKNDSIAQDVAQVRFENGRDRVRFKIDVFWRSLVYGDGKPFMAEKTTITIHRLDTGIRKIDFDIRLKALVPGLQIGGSADKKGYGGFSIRMRLPDDMIFTSGNGPVVPQELQIKAGPWMDFSGRFGISPEISGITILCNPGNPDYPEPWILRQKGSMQNVVYPGRERIDVLMNRPVVLRYRLIIHKGNASSLNIPRLMEEYTKM